MMLPLERYSDKKPYLPTEPEAELINWLVQGFERYRPAQTIPAWKNIVAYSRGRRYWLDWKLALVAATKKADLPPNNILAYANGIYRKQHPDCPMANYVSSATIKSVKKGKAAPTDRTLELVQEHLTEQASGNRTGTRGGFDGAI